MPKISIVIPLYNKELCIRDTINSVISQSFSDYEIIIVDDGSTDNSVSVVENINNIKIKLIKTKNKGVSSARNIGVINALGEYIFFLDADDIILNNCLQDLLNLVIEFPQANIFTANFIIKEPNSMI
jgi:glycosyltransferase involved in cell wall biosynthesis